MGYELFTGAEIVGAAKGPYQRKKAPVKWLIWRLAMANAKKAGRATVTQADYDGAVTRIRTRLAQIKVAANKALVGAALVKKPNPYKGKPVKMAILTVARRMAKRQGTRVTPALLNAAKARILTRLAQIKFNAAQAANPLVGCY